MRRRSALRDSQRHRRGARRVLEIAGTVVAGGGIIIGHVALQPGMNHADRFVRLSRNPQGSFRRSDRPGSDRFDRGYGPREIGVGRIDPIEGDVLNAWDGPEVLDVCRRGDIAQRGRRKGLVVRHREISRGIGASDPVVINGLGLETGEDFSGCSSAWHSTWSGCRMPPSFHIPPGWLQAHRFPS